MGSGCWRRSRYHHKCVDRSCNTSIVLLFHVDHRSKTYKIGTQLVESGYDFFAGSDFATPDDPDKAGENLYVLSKNAGYKIVRGYKEYQKNAKKADKMILLQSEEANKISRHHLPFAIDQTNKDLSLTDITRAAINFLTKKQNEKDGFFLMVEGGKIDWACHPNETATFIHELIDMDDAVRVAYEFYQQHPDETLIVITADHETGGFVMGTGSYNLYLDRLRYTKMSIEKLGKEIHKMHDKYGDKFTKDMMKNYLKENFGFWSKLQLTDEQTKRIETAFENIMAGRGESQETLYQKDDELAITVKRILDEQAHISWASGGHSNGYVPAFAIGVGAEQFQGRIDNTEIPKKMAAAAGWTAE